jgi:colanic acid biosynthesis glycosyl transferase WcaI
MKFLILTLYFPPEIGGAQTRLKFFSSELVRLGHHVEVVTAFPNYPRGQFFAGYERGFYRRECLDGLTIHRVWVYPAVGGGLRRLLNYSSFMMTCLFGLWRSKKPDYIFVESPPLFMSIPAFLAGLLWGVPFIFNVADLWPDVIVQGGFLKEGSILRGLQILEKYSYRKAAYVNTVTEWILEVLREKKGVPAEKLLFLPNGVDTAHFRPRSPDEKLKHELGLAGKQIILWAGTLGYAHAIENILQAAKLLEREPDIHFLFVGDGSAKNNLIALKQSMALSNVTFHDPVPLNEIPNYYSICVCGLASLTNIPLNSGARPSKVFPVLASGKPLIFVGDGEGADLVNRAKAGVVVQQGDPQALAESLSNIVRNSAVASELGQNGRRFVEDHLQWSKLVEEWLSSLASARPGDSAQALLHQRVGLL